MVNYREIIRLKTLDYSNARVASSCGSSRNTVAEVWNLAKEKNLIASHPRRQYSQEPFYVPEHMPEKHRRYLEYNAESFLEWAMGVGPSTLGVVKRFLTLHKVEQQGYKPCTSLMRLADRYSMERLEKACERALGYTPEPSLKNITAILKNGQDKVRIPVDSQRQSSAQGITRGASYFRGGDL